jgi:DNA polymerase-1
MALNKLVVDGDIYVYRIAAACQKTLVFGDEVHTSVNREEMTDQIKTEFRRIEEDYYGTVCAVAFSCPSSEGFRKKLYPQYKENRKGTQKPVGFGYLKEFVSANYNVLEVDELEADDILAICATTPDKEYHVVSTDKDFLTVPGWAVIESMTMPQTNPHWAGHCETWHRKQSEEEAQYYHFFQTLTGDPTDNYPGCPGVGKVTAKKLLDEDCSWKTVVEAYEQRGLTEEDALTNARCAYLLQYQNYDFKKKKVKLWQPK